VFTLHYDINSAGISRIFPLTYVQSVYFAMQDGRKLVGKIKIKSSIDKSPTKGRLGGREGTYARISLIGSVCVR
jgi:hypothetical protein